MFDLPPKNNIEELTDRERFERLRFIFYGSPCTFTAPRYFFSKRMNWEAVSEKKDPIEFLYAACVLSYVDKSFHNCMKQQNVNLPDDVLKVLTESVLSPNTNGESKGEGNDATKVSGAADHCFGMNNPVRFLRENNDLMRDRERLTALYQREIDVVIENRDYDWREEEEQNLERKMEMVERTCRPMREELDLEVASNQRGMSLTQAMLNFFNCNGTHLCGKVLYKCMNSADSKSPSGQSFLDCVNRDEYLQCAEEMQLGQR